MYYDYIDYKGQKNILNKRLNFYMDMIYYLISILGPRTIISREILEHSITDYFSLDGGMTLDRGSKLVNIMKLVSNNLLFNPKSMSVYDVTKGIEELLSDLRISNLDFMGYGSDTDVSHYASLIAKNPIEAFESFLKGYAITLSKINELDEKNNKTYSSSTSSSSMDVASDSKKDVGIRKQSSSTNDILGDNMESWISYLKRIMNSSDPHLKYDDENKIKRDLDKQLSVLDGTGQLVLTGVQIQRIKRYFQQYEADRKNILKRAEAGPVPNFRYLCMLHDLILRNLPDELLMADSSVSIAALNSKDLRNLVGFSHIFEDYQYCYDVYMKAVAKLPSAEQDNALNEVYNGKKASELPDSDHLKDLVNLRVIDKMSEMYNGIMYGNFNMVLKIVNACKYMSSSYVYSLYLSTLNKVRNLSNEQHAKLQDKFIKAILILKNLDNLPLEEKDKKIIEIVKEILHDEFLYTKDGSISVAVGKSYGKKPSGRLEAAANNAQSRFFGMSKLQQTMAKMSGRWQKLLDLEEKARNATIAEEDGIADELDAMFRKM